MLILICSGEKRNEKQNEKRNKKRSFAAEKRNFAVSKKDLSKTDLVDYVQCNLKFVPAKIEDVGFRQKFAEVSAKFRQNLFGLVCICVDCTQYMRSSSSNSQK